MSKIMDLREKRKALWEQTKAFLEDHRDAETGLVAKDAVEQYNKMTDDVRALGQEIQMLEDQMAFDAELAKPTSQPVVNPVSPKAVPPSDKADETKAFWDYIRFGIVRNDVTPMSTGTGAKGEYTVPDEFDRELVQKLTEANVIRRIARVISTSSGTHEIPVAGGDIAAAWTTESTTAAGSAIPETTETFSQVTLNAYKLGARLKVSNELLADSAFNLQSYISEQFATAFGAKEEQAFIVGTGATGNQPTGIFTIASGDIAARVGAYLGVTTVSNTDTLNTISFDSLFQLYYSLKSPYRSNAAWLTSEEAMLALMTIKDSTGQYLWKPSLDIGKPDTILGRPVYTSPYVPTFSSATTSSPKDIVAFGDFSRYWIADRANRSFKRLNELYAETDQTGFLATQRVDGKLILPEAIKVLRTGAAPQG